MLINKKKKVMISTLLILCMLPVLLSVNSTIAYADVPYQTYSYNSWGEGVVQPHAYLYSGKLTSKEFGTTLNYPQDLFIYQNEIFIADTDNSRILKMSDSGEILMELTCAESMDDPLNKPQGVFVTDEGHIYVADTNNGRIVEFDSDGSFIRAIGRPVTDLISDTQEYRPTKVVVDHTGRIYAIAYGINMGLVEFNRDGRFQGFMGAAKVSVNAFEYIWKNYFSTEEQQARMQTIVPTEYSNIFVDQEDFLYATISNLSDEDYMEGADAIRRLNPTGKDILRRLGSNPIIGDLYSNKDSDWSVFSDVCATDYGCYYILDSAGGKIFAYDYDGNSLFCFGAVGNREGMMQKPTALGITENADKIYVLDSLLDCILIYDITEYGRCLLSALELNSKGDSQGSNQEWQKVLKLNANCELAYIGLGKTYLKEGNYRKAMDYFKLGNSRKYYTKAFYYYRKTVMEDNFSKLMAGIIAVVLLVMVIYWVKRLRRWVGEVRCTMSKH